MSLLREVRYLFISIKPVCSYTGRHELSVILFVEKIRHFRKGACPKRLAKKILYENKTTGILFDFYEY